MKQIKTYIIEKLQVSKAKNQDSVDFDITYDIINNMMLYGKFYIDGYDGLCQVTIHTGSNKRWGLIIYTDTETFEKVRLKGTAKSIHPLICKKFVPFIKDYTEFEINDYPDMSICMSYDKYIDNVNNTSNTELPTKRAKKKFIEWLHYFTDYTGKQFASYSINEKLKINKSVLNDYKDSYSWEGLLSLNYWDVFETVDFKEVFGNYLTIQNHTDITEQLRGVDATHMKLGNMENIPYLEIFITKHFLKSNTLIAAKEKLFINLFGEDVLPIIYNYMCNRYLHEKH